MLFDENAQLHYNEPDTDKKENDPFPEMEKIAKEFGLD